MNRASIARLINWLFFIILWAGGIWLAWQFTPLGPRDGWQIPPDQFFVGFLSHENTLVTIPRLESGFRTLGTKETGPIRVWNYRTGELLATHFDRHVEFESVRPDGKYLKLLEEQSGGDAQYRLRLIDALTGNSVRTYTTRVPQQNLWWILTADQRYSVFQSYNGKELRVEIHDIQTGKSINVIEGYREVIWFSRDSSHFVAISKNRMDVGIFHTSNGELVSVVDASPNGKPGGSIVCRLSPDNRTVVLPSEGTCYVSDVMEGKLRFKVSGIYYNSFSISPDGRYLCAVKRENATYHLCWFNLATGEEELARRTYLDYGEVGTMHLSLHHTLDGQAYFKLDGMPRIEPAPQWLKWLASKHPKLSTFGQDKAVNSMVIIDANTGAVLARAPFAHGNLSPDGQTLVVADAAFRYFLSNIPPGKAWLTFLTYAGSLSAMLLLMILWRWRRTLATSPSSPGASPETQRSPHALPASSH